MAMRFALVARRENRLEDIRFFFFGPGLRVPGQIREDEALKGVLGDLLESGIVTLACIYNARQLEQEDALREADVEMRAVGPELTALLARGYQIMTF